METNLHDGAGDEWLTPPDLLRRLGVFDLDPCSPVVRPWDTAKKHFTREDNGLIKEWFGRVWVNPPYSKTAQWMRRLIEHRKGMALVNAKTQTRWFEEGIWNGADAVLFVKGKIKFFRPDGSLGTQGWSASVIGAYSQEDASILFNCGIKGKFVPLIITLAADLRSTWRQLIRHILKECGGVATIEQLYELANGHPKTNGKNHWKAKVRQQVQREGRRIGPRLWQLNLV